MTTATQLTPHRVASAINALRPDWPITSLLALLKDDTVRNKTLEDVTIAAVRLALDPNVRTPGQLRNAGDHWRSTFGTPEQHRRPEPPPISQLQLGVDKPADAAPHIEAMRTTLRHKRGQAIPVEVADALIGTG